MIAPKEHSRYPGLVFRRMITGVSQIVLLLCSVSPLLAGADRELAERHLFVLQQRRFEFLREPKSGTAEKLAYRKLFGETDALVARLEAQDEGREVLQRWLRLEASLATRAYSPETHEKLLSLQFLSTALSIPPKPEDRKSFLDLLRKTSGRSPSSVSEEESRVLREIDRGEYFLDIRF